MRASGRRPRVIRVAVGAGILALALLLGPGLPAEPALASTAGIQSSEYWLDSYGIRAAWSVTEGAGQRIAVIDTGIDSTHPDLQGAVVDGADFSGRGAANGQRPVSGTDSEHGTLVASLAAGRGRGVEGGVLGAAPQASLLSVSIGVSDDRSDTEVAEAVRWSVDHGATVINLSFTRNTPDWPTSWDTAFLYAEQHNVVIVAAAGNRSEGTTEVGAPATIPGVLTVAGVTQSGRASQNASSQGITIGVAAPSEGLVGDLPNDGYATWSGTSGATPIVAGIVALVRAAHPELNAANVINRILKTARGAGPADLYGSGLVDARAAVEAKVASVNANPLGSLSEWIHLYRRATPGATPAPSGAPSRTTPSPVPPRGSDAATGGPTIAGALLIGMPAAAAAAILAVWLTLLIGVVRAVRSRRPTR